MDTPLRSFHDRRLAVLTTYRDYEIPIQYQGVLGEHNWTRTKASLFDFGYLLIPSTVRAEISEDLTAVGLHGPLSKDVLRDLEVDIASTGETNVEFVDSRWGTLACSPSSGLGELGFDIFVPVASADEFCERLDAHEFVRPVGLAAYNSLRIEAGIPLQGYEFDVADGSDLAPVLEDQQTRLVGLTSIDGDPLKSGSPITDKTGKTVGLLTSATYGTTVGAHIGLGYVSSQIEYGETLESIDDNTPSNIRLTQLPFLKPSS